MKKRAMLAYAAVAALCLTVMAGCSSEEAQTVEETPGYWESQNFDDITGSDFIKVGESGGMQLLLDPGSGTIRWLDTSTGVYQDTNMSHDEGDIRMSDAQQSDIIVTYFNGTVRNNKLYSTTARYDSYSMCASLGQLSYQLIDNGVRIIYTLGDDSVTYRNMPLTISDERMQEYVMQYLDDKQVNTLKTYYTQMVTGEWYRRFNTNDQNKIGKLALSEAYGLFYEIGQYTDELLYEDLETWEVDPEEYPSNLSIIVPVEYYLEDGELVVNMDTSLIETGKDNPINQIVLLPYFLTSATDNDAEEGYMLIPDGSGALMYLDSTKLSEYNYSASYYTGDKLVNATNFTSVNNEMMMPVLGMKTSTSTIFGVIENGAEVAKLEGFVSGYDNGEPFSKLRLTFDIQTQQYIRADGTSQTNGLDMYKASDDIYDENITIRYYWLGKDAEYLDMANCYAQYLEERGMLTREAVEEEAPFYVELLGATDKQQFFLGIPYEGTQTLTTFSQAQEILEDLTAEGLKNMKVIYSGMVNDGMNQRSLAGGVKLVSGLGGKSGLNKLNTYAESIGAQIFPNLMLQTAHTKDHLSNSASAWNIVNERAQIYSFSPVTREVDDETDYPLYIINPTYQQKYLSNVKKSYGKKVGLDTMASSDLFTFIATNYKGEQISASTGEDMLKDAVSEFTDGLTLMLSNPISDAYSYASYLTDIPTEDSGQRVLDASVPFMQLVLDGYKTFSSETLNGESTDVYLNFMRAIESNSVPKFTFTYEDSFLLSGTEQEDYFAVDYSYWKDKVGAYYEEYKAFYDLVKGAVVTGHELYERNDTLRIVTYSNGVKVYFNYSDLEEKIDGVTVPAFSYVIQ